MTDIKIGYALSDTDELTNTYGGFIMCPKGQEPDKVWVKTLEGWTMRPPQPSPLVVGLEMRKNLIPLYAEAKTAAFMEAYSASLAEDSEVPLAIIAGTAAKIAFDDAWMDVSNSVYIALSTGNIDRAKLLLERAGDNPLADEDVLFSMLAVIGDV